MGLEIPAASAIASTEAAWKPFSANARSATASICRSRTARGTLRLPLALGVTDCTVRVSPIGAHITLRNLLPVTLLGGNPVAQRKPHRSPSAWLLGTLPAAAVLAWPAAASAQVSGNQSNPAGGAALGEVILATGMATVVTVLALLVVIGHRTGRIDHVSRLGAHAERVTGIPGWASLPLAFVGGSLIVAVLGMYWDISLHIDNGRDPGPLANPAHYLILFGLFGIFVAGLFAISLPKDGKPCSTAVRLQRDWYAPLGGVLMVACAAFALAGFPLDDLWHRIFGQDVTLWGPTHLML